MNHPSPKVDIRGKTKTKFTPEDDRKLIAIIDGTSNLDWQLISIQMGNKSPRQCRERWQNYLDPRLQKKPWTENEDRQIMIKYGEIGARWNAIARSIKGRSGNAVRNRYMMLIRRKERSLKIKENLEKAPSAGNTFVLPQCNPADDIPNFLEMFENIFGMPFNDEGFDGSIDAFASIYE